MKKLPYAALAVLSLILAFVACTKEKSVGETKLNLLEPKLPNQPYDYAHIERPDYIPSDRISINNDKATLGRVLFYDKMLSINNTIACASCHIQQFAFSDGEALSKGVSAQKTHRNSMAIMNPDRANGLFWDLRETSLFDMVLKPIQNHVEMGFDKMDNVVANIKQTPYYAPLFTKAFGSEEVTADRISNALTNFLSAMKSHNSKFDIGMQTNFANFTSQELLGYELMTQKLYCRNCHTGPDFGPNWQTAANIGLDLNYQDEGIGSLPDNVNGNGGGESQSGVFKIPSLRNIELTAPYMHDGRFKTLEAVVEHYNSGVQNHKNLDWNLKSFFDQKTGKQTGDGLTPIRLNLSANEKAALVAFLKTLTDYSYVNNQIYSDPFRVVE
jgi:cytochrome c peroxidase